MRRRRPALQIRHFPTAGQRRRQSRGARVRRLTVTGVMLGLLLSALPSMGFVAPDDGRALVVLPSLPQASATVHITVPDDGCPDGFDSLGRFDITHYAMAEETVVDPEAGVSTCGVEGRYQPEFLADVKLQGSGRAADGRIIRWAGGGCYAESHCALTASGRCAKAGRTVAVDRSVIPMGSTVWIEGHGVRTAEDVGGAVKGGHVDVFVDGGVPGALRAGRRMGTVCVPEGSSRP